MSELLRGFTIRTRMIGAIVMVNLLIGLIVATALAGGYRLRELNHHFTEHSVHELRAVSDLRSALGDLRRHEKSMVIDYENGVAVLKHREAWLETAKQLDAALQAMLQGEEDADNPHASAARTNLNSYVTASKPILDNIQNGAYDTATAADRQLDKAKEHVVAVEKAIAEISRIVLDEVEQTQRAGDAAMRSALVAFIAVTAAVLLIVAPLTLLNSRSIVQPIQEARLLAGAIAQGDLTRSLHIAGRDEAAELQRSLVEMQHSLRAMVGQVRSSTESIGTASAEIATGNQDLSVRTEQTASNLQQAASSMTQLTSTVNQSADSARQANQLAASAAEVAQRGGTVVAQVVATMNEINTSSNRIADIIGVIDGIAFQTNILALNAAVEAARAGEQGRGFAVVAGEVRSLAQRSASAAREIKSLIGTSVEKVESGSKLVADAGTTMNEIVASVQRVTDIIGEITASATEQSEGIGQVNGAVGQLDQMTQQNAALVEQSAAAAESLKEQAVKLARVVNGFKVDDSASAHHAPVPVAAPKQPAVVSKAASTAAPKAPTKAPTPVVARAPAPTPASAPAPAPAAPAAVTTDEWESF